MKKMVLCIVMMLCSICAGNVFAQRVVDVRRTETAPAGNGKQKYFLMLDTVRLEVSPAVHKIVEANPTAYCVVEHNGEKSVFLRSALEAPEEKFVFEVEQVGLENDLPKVTFTDGGSFSDSDLRWLAVLPGQHVQISKYRGITHELAIFETVSRSTPLSEGTSGDAVKPMKSRLAEQLDEVQKARAAQTQAQAPAKVQEVAQDVAQATTSSASAEKSGPMTITFGRR